LNLSLIVLAIGFVTVWIVSIGQRASRSWRFVASLGAWSVILATTVVWPSQLGRLIEIGLAVVWLAAVVRPDRFGIGSWTTSDLVLYRSMVAVRTALDDAADPRLAEARRLLASPAVARAEGDWASAVRLYRRHVDGLSAGTGPADPAKATNDRLRLAGTHYWSVAMNRRVIGARERPSRWDEGTLLRCFSEEYNNLIPQADEPEGRPTPPLDWAERANDLIEALDTTEFVAEPVRELQETVEEAMEAGLAIALGDSSPEAISRYRASEEQLRLGWERMTSAVV
jgi:hypothetical protein